VVRRWLNEVHQFVWSQSGPYGYLSNLLFGAREAFVCHDESGLRDLCSHRPRVSDAPAIITCGLPWGGLYASICCSCFWHPQPQAAAVLAYFADLAYATELAFVVFVVFRAVEGAADRPCAAENGCIACGADIEVCEGVIFNV
jgi:hypothetical protein